MPKYDAACRQCGSKREVRLSYQEYDQVRAGKAVPRADCVLCDQPSDHQLAGVQHTLATQFKGTGFYVTDSRDEIEQFQFRNLDRD